MSLRSLSKINLALAVLGLAAGVSYGVLAYADTTVQTYADTALPVQTPDSETYFDSPLKAGTLTLQDVLEAHKPQPALEPKLPAIGATPSATATAPLITKPGQSSSTGMMLSQGMKEVLQKVNSTAAPVLPSSSAAQAQGQAVGQPAPLVSGSAAAETAAPVAAAVASTPAPAAKTTENCVTYQPGQAPKNLAASVSASAPAAATEAAEDSGDLAVTPVDDTGPAPAAKGTCGDQSVQRWEKSCGDAGYPATYLGKIVGETRTGCADGSLHDVWVTNTCAPPDVATSQTAKTDGVCGAASNNEYDKAPADSLCGQGIPSAVNGGEEGPWTWACSGVNGGDAAACIAQKRVPPLNGACGDANGVAVAVTPADDLCKAGAASSVKGGGPWTWSCKGVGKGRSESCIAPVATHAKAEIPEAVPVAAPAPVSSPAPVPVEEHVAASVPSEAVASAPATEAASDANSLCGAASETLAYEAPDKDLCRAGTASVVNGDGPWTWACTNNEGVTSSCRTLSLEGGASSSSAPAATPAPSPTSSALPQASESILAVHPKQAAPVLPSVAPAPEPELACGLAASQPSQLAPASDLCQGGKASKVHGVNPWRWTCSKGKRKISCETPKATDGSCGPANGAALKSAPFSGLCSSGAPSSVAGDGPWTWACNGSGGGVDVSCAASVQSQPEKEKIDGACGTASGASLKNTPEGGSLCASGMPSSVSGEGPWSWSCSGANGGSVGSCSANKIVPPKPPGPTVNGLCGSANGETSVVQPSEGLCASGDASNVVGNGPWNWSCSGENGGMNVSCTAPLEAPAAIDGACGGASGVPTLVKPVSGLCSAGITGTVNGRGPWTWTCSGANGGQPASCIAPVAGKSASTPSVMTPATVPLSAQALPQGNSPPAKSGSLTTPHLASSGSEPPLDNGGLPSLTPSKQFDSAPAPSQIPGAAEVTGDSAPNAAPDLPPGSTALTPPAFSNSLPEAPALQEKAVSTPHIPGNHLTLDRSLSSFAFMRASGNIDDRIVPSLDQLATILQANPDVRIALYAYADNTNSTPRDARRLSLTRALAIRTYLAAKGIAESRIDVHAEGANTSSTPMDRVDVKVNG